MTRTNQVLYPVMFLGLSISTAVQAQIPVTDLIVNEREIIEWLEESDRWDLKEQGIEDRKEQLEETYNAATGSRALGDIANDPTLRQYLPDDWKAVYDTVMANGSEGLSGSGATIWGENRIYDYCESIELEALRTACQSNLAKPAQDKGFIADAYKAASERLAQIDKLMQAINLTEDPKGIAELQARIAIEEANIQNEQIRVQLFSMLVDAQQQIQDQRIDEISTKQWSSKGAIHLEPLTFDD